MWHKIIVKISLVASPTGCNTNCSWVPSPTGTDIVSSSASTHRMWQNLFVSSSTVSDTASSLIFSLTAFDTAYQLRQLTTCLLTLPGSTVVGEQGSSVSIVSGYGLDDRAIEVRSPAEARGFFTILCVQTGSEAHPATCTMGTGDHFPRGKARPGYDADHSPHPVPRSWVSRSYASSPLCASIRVLWNFFGALNNFINGILVCAMRFSWL
jgi:hypothetical protein